MKKLSQQLVGLALSVSLAAGSFTAYTGVNTVNVCAAEESEALNYLSGEMSQTVDVTSAGKHEVRFNANGKTLDELKAEGYTKLSISYGVTTYTENSSKGTAGVMPFVSYGEVWKNDGVWANLKDANSGTLTLDISQFSDSANEAVFGIQFANVTGELTYSVTSAKLVKSGSASDSLALTCTTDNTSGDITLSGDTYTNEVKFKAEGYTTLDEVKSAGYTTLSITYNVSNYTQASGKTAGVQPFVTYGEAWKNLNNWHNLSDGTSGTLTLDFSSLSDSTNSVAFGIQFTNVTGALSYNVSSAKLIKGSGSGGSSSGGSSVTDSTDDVNEDIELNYAKLLQESLYFYDANMCGTDVNEKSELSWRSDCHTYDQTATYNGKTIDLSGGYHDAGDHAKFGLPAAYSATVLGVAYMEYKDSFDELGLTAHYTRIVDRFAEYFKKCTVMDESGNVEAFCYQLGQGNADHSYMGIPENQTTGRAAYFTSSSNPCTDVVCETAAALALHYINTGNEESLKYAKALFAYADNNPKGNSASDPGDLYASSKYEDDYALAAAMLYKATGDSSYKTAYNNTSSNGKDCYWALSWDNVTSLVSMYQPDGIFANNTVATYVSGAASGSKKSDGYVNISKWGSARYNVAIQFMGLLYDKKAGTDNYHDWAEGQMSYLLGNNSANRCFVVGYNAYSVVNQHHRAVYGVDNFQSANNNPKHLLIGALVGGPKNIAADYYDNVADYTSAEVALDYNAGLVAAAAALYDYTMQNGTDDEKALQHTIDITTAKANGLSPELRRLVKYDFNYDSVFNNKDVVKLIRHTSGASLMTDTTDTDVNTDGNIDIKDVIVLINKLA